MTREHASRLAPVLAGLIFGLGCRATVRSPSSAPSEPPDHGATTADDGLEPTTSTSTRENATEVAKRAFVKETCALLCAETYRDCRCEVTHEVEDWILLRLADGVADGKTRWQWFVGVSTVGGYQLMVAGSYELHLPPDSEEESVTENHYLCLETTPGTDLPTNGGVDVKTVDATGDGRLDLVVECKQEDTTWGKRLRQTCAGGEEYCHADLF